MYNGTQVTIVGNLGSDPELRYTASGRAVSTFSVAVVMRRKVNETQWEDVNTTWYRVNAWGNLGEHIAESLTRGSRVIVTGTLIARPWEDKDGAKRETWEISADTVGADLTYATVSIKRSNRANAPAPVDPWSGESATESQPAGQAPEPATEPESNGKPASQATVSPGKSRNRTTRSGQPVSQPATESNRI
jgi:single-strand DNA-binding protein